MARHTFTPDLQHPTLGVCSTCGRHPDHESHENLSSVPATVPAEYLPYTDALWAFTLRHGGVPNIYGGTGHRGTVSALLHLFGDCAVDTERSMPPRPGTLEEFAGTFADNATIAVTLATIYCDCGLIDGVGWRIKGDLTLGEIIYRVVQSGDPSAASDPEIAPCPEHYRARLEYWRENADAGADDLLEAVWRAEYHSDYWSDASTDGTWYRTLNRLITGITGYAASVEEAAADLRAIIGRHPGVIDRNDRYALNTYYGWA